MRILIPFGHNKISNTVKIRNNKGIQHMGMQILIIIIIKIIDLNLKCKSKMLIKTIGKILNDNKYLKNSRK